LFEEEKVKCEVKLPRLTETMESATITRWLKNVGDHVGKKDPLYEVETDKAVMDVESIDEGFLCQILVEKDTEIAPGTVIAYLADSWEEC